MAYSSKILLDSTNYLHQRITTYEITFPRIVLAELNTHRVFSRNAASSRAIPVKKMIEKVITDPFIPVWWGKNQKGMEASSEILDDLKPSCEAAWLRARDQAVKSVEGLLEDFDLHKQIANRILEPWMWVTDILTSTTFTNFFSLRCHPSAQPEIKKIADMMKSDYTESKPKILGKEDWHLPMTTMEDHLNWDLDELKETNPKMSKLEFFQKISTGRCARVSYLTHDGIRNPLEDIRLAEQLIANNHASPAEHCAQNMETYCNYGNFTGWKQYRKFLEECNDNNSFGHISNHK